MADNTLTDLIPDIYSALNIVSREQAGMITAVFRDSTADRVPVNGTVRVPIAPAAAAEDLSADTNPPDTGSQTITNTTITITNQRAVPFRWTGEEQAGMKLGPGYTPLRVQQITQAIRTLVNEVETDLNQLYIHASRAFGAAGTTPFATVNELDDLSESRRILVDNGAPTTDLQMVLSTAASAKMFGFQSSMWKVNEAGSDEFRRNGMVGNNPFGLMGFQIRETGQSQLHTKGTATGYDPDAIEPVDETTIVCSGSDSGTVLAGDVVTWSGDTNKYIVSNGTQTLSGNGTGNLIINLPGLREELAAGTEGTTGANYTANLAFSRSAIVLAARLPYLPEEGDAAFDMLTVTDPNTGMVFEFAMYKQFRRVRYHVALAWGVAAIKPEHIMILLG